MLDGLCGLVSRDFSQGIDVHFSGESGVGDGIQREYMHLVAEEFSDPHRALLVNKCKPPFPFSFLFKN